MSTSNKKVLKDSEKMPIPQYYNPEIDDYEATLGYNGGALSIIGGVASKAHVFHNSATVSADGIIFMNSGFKDIVTSIKGTNDNASRLIVFEQADIDDNWFPLIGLRTSNVNTIAGTETSGKDEVWKFDIKGVRKFRVRIVSVTGGSLTIKGNAVV